MLALVTHCDNNIMLPAGIASLSAASGREGTTERERLCWRAVRWYQAMPFRQAPAPAS